MRHLAFLVLSLCSLNVFVVHSVEYKPRYQPELDSVKIDTYINNKRLFDLQVKCIVYDGPCDIVGRWVKPRVAAALLGECILCTPHQHNEVNRLLAWMQDHRPDIFKKIVTKYLENIGIEPPKDNKFGPVTSKPYDPSKDPNYNGTSTMKPSK